MIVFYRQNLILDMKPNDKNRVVCPDCGKAKMLFKSKKSAEKFIEYNGKDIDTGGNPLRSYYCPACCGYHITKRKYRKSYSTRTDNLINAYHSSLGSKKKIEKQTPPPPPTTEQLAQDEVNKIPLEIFILGKGSVKKYITETFRKDGEETLFITTIRQLAYKRLKKIWGYREIPYEQYHKEMEELKRKNMEGLKEQGF